MQMIRSLVYLGPVKMPMAPVGNIVWKSGKSEAPGPICE